MKKYLIVIIIILFNYCLTVSKLYSKSYTQYKDNKIKDFLVSDEFKVDGSKGISLNYRKKTKQLRQTMLLVSSNNWVTEVATIESFKNSKNNLDTLVIIQKEIECNINNYEN